MNYIKSTTKQRVAAALSQARKKIPALMMVLGATMATEISAQSTTSFEYHDVLMTYTPAALADANGEVKDLEQIVIDGIEYTNQAFINSGANIRLRLVDIIAGEDLGDDNYIAFDALRSGSDGRLDNVTDYRQVHGADFIGVISGSNQISAEHSGIASGDLFSIRPFLPERLFAHEIGHLEGLSHDRGEFPEGEFPGDYNFGYSYYTEGGTQIRTIMAYAGVAAEIPYFSSPEVEYNGNILGIDPAVDPANGAWAVRTLNENASSRANIRAAYLLAANQLTATNTTKNSVTLEWQDHARRETHYEVRIDDQNSGTSDTLLINSSDTVFDGSETKSAVIDNLKPGTTYGFSVRPYAADVSPFRSPATGVISVATNSFDAADIVPGIVEAENFSNAEDASPENAGGQYRDTDVDVSKTQDNDYFVGWIDSQESLEYKIDVQKAGDYTVRMRVASAEALEKTVYFKDSNGNSLTDFIRFNTDGLGWEEWVTVETPPMTLNEGVQTITLTMESGSFNIESMEFNYLFESKFIEAETNNESSYFELVDDLNVSGGQYMSGVELENFYAQMNLIEWQDKAFEAGDSELVVRVKSSDGELRKANVFIEGIGPNYIETTSTEWEDKIIPVSFAESASINITYRNLPSRLGKEYQVLDLDYIDIVTPDTEEPLPSEEEPNDLGKTFEAEDFDAESEAGSGDEYSVRRMDNKVGYIKADGNWIRFNQVNFGDGPSTVSVKASSGTSGGRLVFRTHPLYVESTIATVDIFFTNGWSAFQEFRADVIFPEQSAELFAPTGTRDLYVTFESDTNNGYVFDLDSFRFD